MLAIRPPGVAADVAPNWLVDEASPHSKYEFQRTQRGSKGGGGGGKGDGITGGGGGRKGDPKEPRKEEVTQLARQRPGRVMRRVPMAPRADRPVRTYWRASSRTQREALHHSGCEWQLFLMLPLWPRRSQGFPRWLNQCHHLLYLIARPRPRTGLENVISKRWRCGELPLQ